MEKFNELKTLIAGLEEDATKFFEKGNKTSGLKLRKGLQTIKAVSQALRLEVSEKNKLSKKTK